MRTYLQEEFFVSAHGSAQDLLNFLSANACDLIVSDISLPEMDGFALVAAIRSNPALRDLPVIAASAHITEIGREKARRAGFDAFLAKPVDPDQLLLTIKRYLPHNRSA
jgi:CheY-like chemotaxis protein